MNNDNNKNVAVYVRVSTGYQVDKDSLPHQKKEIVNYCVHVLHIDKKRIEIFEDAGKSGKNTNRPGFERMMKKVRAGLISHVVVYKIDRISRNLVDFSIMYDDFKYHRVTFISLNEQFDTSSAIGEAVLKIILVFAELERKLTSERVKDIMISRATEGLWNGARVPFGWDWDEENKIPIHSPVEGPFVHLMYDLYEDCHSSCKVRDYCNDNNIPTKRGGKWTSKTVADLIRNPLNKGDYRYNYRESARGRKKPEEEVVYVEDAFPALIEPDQWNRCNKIMDLNCEKRHQQGFQPLKKHCHAFGGILICGKCGATFHASKDRIRSNGFFPSTYRCGNKTGTRACDALGITDVVLGPFIFNYISNMVKASKVRKSIDTPDALEEILLNGKDFKNIIGIKEDDLFDTFQALQGKASSGLLYSPDANLKKADNISVDLKNLKDELSKYTRALERLKKAYLFDDDSMNEKEYLSTKTEIEGKIVDIKNKILDAEDDTYSQVDELSFVKAASSFLVSYKLQSGEYIKYNEFAASIEDQVLKDFVNLVIDSIQIDEGRVSVIRFNNGLVNTFLYR